MRKSNIISLNGKDFQRDFELIGDVEKVRWYELKYSKIPVLGEPDIFESEVYDQEELDKLEIAYESSLVSEMYPTQTII